ncbi:MAG: hypothetical protein ACRDRL_26235 [Sciscionella sp.]
MYEQGYYGTCPADDPEGFGIGVKLSHPRDVEYPHEITIGCPIESLGGDDCPDGGSHTLAAIGWEQYAAIGADDEGNG